MVSAIPVELLDTVEIIHIEFALGLCVLHSVSTKFPVLFNFFLYSLDAFIRL